jgi:hypothetical protein
MTATLISTDNFTITLTDTHAFVRIDGLGAKGFVLEHGFLPNSVQVVDGDGFEKYCSSMKFLDLSSAEAEAICTLLPLKNLVNNLI